MILILLISAHETKTSFTDKETLLVMSRNRVTSRNMLTAWLPHDIHMVHAWTMEIKSRV